MSCVLSLPAVGCLAFCFLPPPLPGFGPQILGGRDWSPTELILMTFLWKMSSSEGPDESDGDVEEVNTRRKKKASLTCYPGTNPAGLKLKASSSSEKEETESQRAGCGGKIIWGGHPFRREGRRRDYAIQQVQGTCDGLQ
jgi:hypothetical protein